MDYARKCTTELSVFTRGPTRFFSSITVGGRRANQFIRYASTGESAIVYHAWQDNRVSIICQLFWVIKLSSVINKPLGTPKIVKEYFA